jgi:hypothetical protein
LLFALGERALTNPPTGKALAFDHGKQLVVAFGIGNAKRSVAIVAVIELVKVAVKMGFAAVPVDAYDGYA